MWYALVFFLPPLPTPSSAHSPLPQGYVADKCAVKYTTYEQQSALPHLAALSPRPQRHDTRTPPTDCRPPRPCPVTEEEYEADTGLDFALWCHNWNDFFTGPSGATVTVRSVQDPYAVAGNLTNCTMEFGSTPRHLTTVGVGLMLVRVALRLRRPIAQSRAVADCFPPFPPRRPSHAARGDGNSAARSSAALREGFVFPHARVTYDAPLCHHTLLKTNLPTPLPRELSSAFPQPGLMLSIMAYFCIAGACSPQDFGLDGDLAPLVGGAGGKPPPRAYGATTSTAGTVEMQGGGTARRMLDARMM